jgi:hypothetical protein
MRGAHWPAKQTPQSQSLSTLHFLVPHSTKLEKTSHSWLAGQLSFAQLIVVQPWLSVNNVGEPWQSVLPVQV